MNLTFWKKKRKPEEIILPSEIKAGKIEAGQKATLSVLGSVLPSGSIISKKNFIFDFDIDQLKKYPTTTLLKNLHYLNPDASMAIWTILRLANSGYNLKVTNLDGSEFEEGYNYIFNEVLPQINRDRGGFDGFVDMIHKTTLVMGAGSCEVVLAPDLRTILDFVAVDPATVYFKQETLPDGRINYVPFQYQRGGQVLLDKEGFYYVPLDVDIGDPNGISPIVSMLQVIFFQMQLYADLQRVIHSQGYPRIDVKILEEVIRNNAPRTLLNNPKKLVAFIDEQIKSIKSQYANLKVDDAFIHTDAVEVKVVESNQQMGSNARAILDAVDKSLANAMHILTIFINKHRGITETYGSVQWKIQVKTIESFQRVSSRIINQALTFALNIAGYQGNARIEYEPIPTESPFQQEEAEIMKVKRVTLMRDAGYISHDTAAALLTDMEHAEAEPVAIYGPKGVGDSGSGGNVNENNELGNHYPNVPITKKNNSQKKTKKS